MSQFHEETFVEKLFSILGYYFSVLIFTTVFTGIALLIRHEKELTPFVYYVVIGVLLVSSLGLLLRRIFQ